MQANLHTSNCIYSELFRCFPTLSIIELLFYRRRFCSLTIIYVVTPIVEGKAVRSNPGSASPSCIYITTSNLSSLAITEIMPEHVLASCGQNHTLFADVPKGSP
jgi:hypothetical protein